MKMKGSEERECVKKVWYKRRTVGGGRWEAIEEAIKN
jgi:hypothetical protein